MASLKSGKSGNFLGVAPRLETKQPFFRRLQRGCVKVRKFRLGQARRKGPGEIFKMAGLPVERVGDDGFRVGGLVVLNVEAQL